MYRPGHYGVALLAYAPLGYGLLAAGHATAAFAGGAGVLLLTPLPDYDQRVPGVTHRGVTHTVLFAAVVAGLLGGAAFLAGASLADRAAIAAFAAAVGALAILAHLLADALTPAGITPLWPLSGRHYSFGLTRADSTVANYLLLAAGVAATAAAATLANAPAP